MKPFLISYLIYSKALDEHFERYKLIYATNDKEAMLSFEKWAKDTNTYALRAANETLNYEN